MPRLGLPPWDGHAPDGCAGRSGARRPVPAALDVGCGTGDTSIYLAQHGWTMTGIDFVKRRSSERGQATAAGVSVRYQRADVTQLSATGVGGGFGLIVDNGCLHGLSAEQRDATCADQRAAVPGARLLIMAFAEQRAAAWRIDRAEVGARFASGWELVAPAKICGVNHARRSAVTLRLASHIDRLLIPTRRLSPVRPS
jgi:SAM-dependent methyltransferase